MDEFRGMLMWTKNTVDGLVPNTEQLLAHSLEQDKAILNIHNDLNEKTNAIIQEIGQVNLKHFPRRFIFRSCFI